MDNVLVNLINRFKIKGRITNISFNNTGNINRTYLVTTRDGQKERKYVFQKINNTVFKEPYLLMQNIENVTNYCKEYLKNNNEDHKRGALHVIKTKDDKNVVRTTDNDFYRLYDFVDNAISYDKTENAETFYNAGKAFGHFVKMLDGYPMESLYETIPNFHNTRSRYYDFLESVVKNPCNRAKNVVDEIKFITDRSEKLGIIVGLIENGEIPLRVTHNDTKINNVLMDKDTNEAICVIDLDTVMPGSALYDFGDAIRSGAATTFEDDTNLDNVGINMEYFSSFTEAYLSETKDILNEKELEYLAFSCILLTIELAMRFLTDYLNGDTYFKCDYEEHNLDRARNQIALVKDMEDKYELMNNKISEILGNKKLVKKKDN